ncbi:MAG: AAA family ATPase, partial [Nitrosomonas sp.]|nr:AAA family ATPase [Nitrosomonas sp.]
MTKIVYDQAAGLRSLVSFQTSDSVRVITIAGGKKGIGKTCVAINLATTLAKNGKRVLLIDENQCQKSISATLGLK